MHTKTQVRKGDDKVLAKMLRDVSPVGWLIAADYLDEIGQPERAESVRTRALATLEIAALFARANTDQRRSNIRLSYCVRSLLGVILDIAGGRKEYTAGLVRKNEQGRWKPVGGLIHLTRKILPRDDYRFRRAAELVDDLTSRDGSRGQK